MKIDYKQFMDSYLDLKEALQEEVDALDELAEAFDYFVNMDSFQGETADSMKAYIKEIHKPIIAGLQTVIMDFNNKLSNTLEEFKSEVDDSDYAVIDTEHLDDIIRNLETEEEEFTAVSQQFDSILGDIADIFTPQTDTRGTENHIKAGYDESIDRVNEVKHSLVRFDEAHDNDCNDILETLVSLDKLIAFTPSVMKKDGLNYNYDKLTYSNDLKQINEYMNNVYSDILSPFSNTLMINPFNSEFSNSLSNNVEAVSNDKSDQRVEDGLTTVMEGLGIALVGALAVTAVIATGGTAAPILAAIVATSGGIAMSQGVSDVVEGAQDIVFGLNDDTESQAINPLRDSVFMGNQELYDMTEFASTTVSTLGADALLSYQMVYGDETIDDDIALKTNMENSEIQGNNISQYSSLRDLMESDEVKLYDKYWEKVAEDISSEVIDYNIAYIKNGGITKAQGGAYRPSKVSAAVNMNTGEISVGYSGKRGFNPSKPITGALEPSLQELVDNTKKVASLDTLNPLSEYASYERWSVDNCAEVYATNNALLKGADIGDIFLNTKSFVTGEYAEPCNNCKITFKDFIMPR